MATLQETLSGLLGAGGSMAAAYLPYQATTGEMEALKNIVSGFVPQAQALGQELTGVSEFKPFSVKTATGTTDVGAGGGFTQTLSPEAQAIQSGMLAQATGLMGTAAPTAQDLYAQMQAAQAPELQRQRLELENRLQAQGRGGVQTAAYGGTPEQLALEKAAQEQSTKNLLAALTTAPALAGQNLQNIQAALTAGYTPQAQQISTLTPATQLANISQAGQQGMLEALYKTGIAGLQAEAEGAGAVATLEAQRSRALADALQGLFAQSAGVAGSQTMSPVDTLLNVILGGSGSSSSSSSSSGSGTWLNEFGNWVSSSSYDDENMV